MELIFLHIMSRDVAIYIVFGGGFLIGCIWLGYREIRFVEFFLPFDMMKILISWKVALKLTPSALFRFFLFLLVLNGNVLWITSFFFYHCYNWENPSMFYSWI